MPRMRLLSRKVKAVAVFVVGLLAMVCATTGCYQGVSKSEEVRILQTESASPKRVALLVERSDHAALSGTTLFVFISDHPYSISDLRKRLYGLDPIFMAGGSGLTLHWSNSEELTIQCHSCGMAKNTIEKQKFVASGIAVKYVGFP